MEKNERKGKRKYRVFPAMLLVATMGCSLAGCGKSEKDGIAFNKVVTENMNDTCFDDVGVIEEVTISEKDGDMRVSLLEAVEQLEEKIAIYETLPEFSLDEAFKNEDNNETIDSIYTVKENDTLGEIAGKYGLTVEKLMSINNLDSDQLLVDQQLKVTTEKVYSLDEVQELVKKFESEGLSSEQRVDVAKKIGKAKEDANNWLKDNGNNIVESLSMAVIKSSVLDSLDLSSDSFNKVRILSAADSYKNEVADVSVSNYDVDKKGKAISKDLNLKGTLSSLQSNIYNLQEGYKIETEINDKVVKYWKELLNMSKDVVSSKAELTGFLDKNNVKLQKKK